MLPGHTLVAEGAPHDNLGNRLEGGLTGVGRAKCTCGGLSEMLNSTRARQQWHRDHKNQIRGDRVLDEIREAGGFAEWQRVQR